MMSSFQHIQKNLQGFIKKYFLNQLFKGFILFVVFSFLYVFITALIEFLFWLPPGSRRYLFYAQWLVLFLFFVIFILRPLLNLLGISHSLSEEHASQIIGNFFPEIKDKLLNTLQLHHQDVHNELLWASIEQKATELNHFKFSKAVDFKQNFKFLPLLLLPFLILLILRFTHYDTAIKQGYNRVMSYNTYYEPPLPYTVVIPDSLSVLKGNDFKLNLILKGNSLPEKLWINFDNTQHLLQRENDSLFSFYFPVLQDDVSFSISDGKHLLGKLNIVVVYPPLLSNILIKLNFPAYLHKKNKTIKHTGNLVVPQSTTISWIVQTQHADSLFFGINNHIKSYPATSQTFHTNYLADTDFTYQIKVTNNFVNTQPPSVYQVKVVKDAFPQLHVNILKDTLNRVNYHQITASDDYSITQIRLVYQQLPDGKPQFVSIPIQTSDLIQTRFVFPGNISLNEATAYTYYFQAFDNDAVHHYKSVRSKSFFYNNLSEQQKETLLLQQQAKNLNNIADYKKKIEQQQYNLQKLAKKITGSKSLDWQSKKQLEHTFKQAEQQERFFKEAIKKYQQILNKLPIDKRSETQKDLQKRLSELAEMKRKKKLLDELKKIADKLKKEDLIEKLKDLQKYTEHQEKSLERILELTKKYYLEQKLQKISQQLDSLSQKQLDLAQRDDDSRQAQDSLNSQLNKLQKQADSLDQLNKTLKKPISMPDSNTEMEAIKSDMQKASQQLSNKQSKPANRSQQKASNKMKQLAKQLQMSMSGGGEEQNQEDIKTLQALLKSLLNFSFKEENLLTDLYAHNGKSYLSQQLLLQNNLKKYFKHINDSLYTLALRNPKISQTILDEAFEIELNLNKSISYLADNQQYNTLTSAQYILKGANSLADFLSNSLDNMKNSSPSMGQGKGKKGKGFSLPDIIKKQSESISKMKQGLQSKQNNKGSKKGNKSKKTGQNQASESESARQYELYKQQQRIKEDLQQLGDRFSDKALQKKIMDLTKQMDDLQRKLLKEGITQSNLNKMIQLQHELLKLKNATFTQHQDNKRESKTNFIQYNGVDSIFLQKFPQFKAQNELLHRLQIPVNQKVKQKILDFLN